MSDEHTKLCPPVSQVVQAEDVMTKEFHEAGYAVSYDGGPAGEKL